jgi:hypothetical protein
VNKRKRVAWEKHRKTKKKALIKKRAAKVGGAAARPVAV